MILNTILGCVTSNLKKMPVLKENLETFSKKIVTCHFGTCDVLYQKKKNNKKRGWLWGNSKDKEKDELKIIKPKNYAGISKAILSPFCKVAIIVGGSSGFGYAAANELLSKGARNVVIADNDVQEGKEAAQRLCDAYGKDRAWFLLCDIRNSLQFEGVFAAALCRHKEVHILFSDLDKNQGKHPSSLCGESEEFKWNNTRRVSLIGLKHMGKHNGGPGGIIVNSGSILGFMGWSEEPTPVYCREEPVIETTSDVAKEHPFEETGVRFVSLCPTNKQFEQIGLPDFPQIKNLRECMIKCLPQRRVTTIGSALIHVMAQAKTGSTWILPPQPSINELPRLIHFPKAPGEKVDPKIYEEKPCPVALEPHCAKIEENSSMDSNPNCGLSAAKPECNTLFSKKTK